MKRGKEEDTSTILFSVGGKAGWGWRWKWHDGMKDTDVKKGGQSERKSCRLHFWSPELIRLTSCQHGRIPCSHCKVSPAICLSLLLFSAVALISHLKYKQGLVTDCVCECKRQLCIFTATSDAFVQPRRQRLRVMVKRTMSWNELKLKSQASLSQTFRSCYLITIRRVLSVGICLCVHSTRTCSDIKKKRRMGK